MILIFRFFLFLFLLVFYSQLFSQNPPSSAKILFYNTENLFNPENNEGKNDEEFHSNGVRGWNHYRKQVKQNNIARVILYAGKWDPPVLVGLCEIEDRIVLEELIWDTGLNNLDYYIEHFESPDSRGIDVALLYRKNRFRVLNSRPVPVNLGEGKRTTRDILYVSGVLDQSDTLHVMVNHWPSRWGGENTTKSKRLAASKVLKDICDSVLTVSPGALIVAMGDFNDGPSDESLSRLSGTTMEHEKLLINLAHNIRGDVPGTIKYKHQWTCFDQILVSKGLSPRFSKTGMSIKEDEMSVVSPDFLLEPDPEYPGLRPKRTYSGYKYVGGLSDHLPVMIELLRMQ